MDAKRRKILISLMIFHWSLKVDPETKQTHTKHGVELHQGQVQAPEWTLQVVLFGPHWMIEVCLSAERVQHTYQTPDRHTEVHAYTHEHANAHIMTIIWTCKLTRSQNRAGF